MLFDFDVSGLRFEIEEHYDSARHVWKAESLSYLFAKCFTTRESGKSEDDKGMFVRNKLTVEGAFLFHDMIMNAAHWKEAFNIEAFLFLACYFTPQFDNHQLTGFQFPSEPADVIDKFDEQDLKCLDEFIGYLQADESSVTLKLFKLQLFFNDFERLTPNWKGFFKQFDEYAKENGLEVSLTVRRFSHKCFEYDKLRPAVKNQFVFYYQGSPLDSTILLKLIEDVKANQVSCVDAQEDVATSFGPVLTTPEPVDITVIGAAR